jgi:iron(II)-dependent oxidoreductase
MGLKLFARFRGGARAARRQARRNGAAAVKNPNAGFAPAPIETFSGDALERLLQQGRLCIILRDQQKWHSHPRGRDIIEQAKQTLESRMALVPAGSVSICNTLTSQPGAPEEDMEVEPFLLDVHCTTNARFQKFVDAGGYDALEYWPEEIWPHLIELKDQTGQPGPRFWRNGRHDLRISDHPVVGVSWYEAQAYSLWIGQRLPTEAEWQMAASWHINSSTDLMRRFPWGDSMDNQRCNIWSSSNRGTVPVQNYENGAAPNQVRQLIGNVWEWTDTEYYFETQSTNYFRTGQIALARTQNSGFRCAMNLNDASWINGE